MPYSSHSLMKTPCSVGVSRLEGRKSASFLSALPFVLASALLPIQAANDCQFGVCRAYISQKPVTPIQQQTPVWCWAASLSMLFGYYGHPLNQATIVTHYFGGPIAVSGPPWVMRDALNRTWTDDLGRTFR